MAKTDPLYMYDYITSEGRNLTKWEEDFISSIGTQLENGRELSERQLEILERIYAEKTP